MTRRRASGRAQLVATVSIAVAADLLLGDPPSRRHPVAMFGRLLARGRDRLERGAPLGLLVRGGVLAGGSTGLAALAGRLIEVIARRNGLFEVVAQGIALKMAFSLRGLTDSARAIDRALAAGELVAARELVGYHLVSRSTAMLDPPHVISATIESVAENLTDAFIAPLGFYVALGLPGAFAYRAINTADAMLGYRTGTLEWFGKPAARLDDLANLLPARLAACAIVAASALTGDDAGRAWRTMRRDRGRTASPNAGWTMAAMAGALGVRLEKPGEYGVGSGELPMRGDIDRSVRILALASLLGVGSLLLLAAILRRSLISSSGRTVVVGIMSVIAATTRRFASYGVTGATASLFEANRHDHHDPLDGGSPHGVERRRAAPA